jgi:hypothetical protein
MLLLWHALQPLPCYPGYCNALLSIHILIFYSMAELAGGHDHPCAAHVWGGDRKGVGNQRI